MLTREEVDECFAQPSESGFGKSRYDIAEMIESAVLARLNAQEPALVRYNKHMNGEIEPDPVERLRFFLSLALTGQNWFDVEKFLDDLPPADVVRDSERYRWITECPRVPWGMFLPDDALVKVGIDAAIDASMKEMK